MHGNGKGTYHKKQTFGKVEKEFYISNVLES
jgi:hypothetical protein